MDELGGEKFVSISRYFGKTLESEISKLKDPDPILLKLVFSNILKAVEYLHSNDVVHMNLKPSNIICKDKLLYRIKLCDFEFARKVGESVRYENFSVGFSPPENVKNHKNIKAY